jgi:hypothetical protein
LLVIGRNTRLLTVQRAFGFKIKLQSYRIPSLAFAPTPLEASGRNEPAKALNGKEM